MSPTIRPDEPAEELPEVSAGRLPERYRYRMQDVFLARARPLLVDGARILDVGAGRSPTLGPELRAPGTRYVGLDVSRAELESAPHGAYDEVVVADISQPNDSLREFDLILSWQVLEHVPSLEGALVNLGTMLKPGGVLLAQTSASYAAFAILARVLPHRARVRAMARFLGHEAEEKFPIRYDRCTHSAITAMLADWSALEIVPFFRAAPYFSTLRPLQRLYLGYENVIARRQTADLATHYLIVARR